MNRFSQLKHTPILGFVLMCMLALTQTSIAGDVLSVHCPPDNDLVFGHITALSSNPTTKFTDWVAYEVDVLYFGPSPGQGHQAPLASFAGSHHWDELN